MVLNNNRLNNLKRFLFRLCCFNFPLIKVENHFSGEHDRNLLTRRVNTINCSYCDKKYDKSTYIFLTYFFNQFISDSRIFFYLKGCKIRENCFRKKSPSWMFTWVLNTSLKTNQHSALSFSVNALCNFNLFFFAFHTPWFLIFALFLHKVLNTDWVFHVKEKETYLLYDFRAKVI